MPLERGPPWSRQMSRQILTHDMVAWRAARRPPIDRLRPPPSGVRSKGHTSAGGDLCGLYFFECNTTPVLRPFFLCFSTFVLYLACPLSRPGPDPRDPRPPRHPSEKLTRV